MRIRNGVNIPIPALDDVCARKEQLNRACKMQVNTDSAMSSILQANAVRVLDNEKVRVGSDEEKALETAGAFCDCLCYITNDGFISAQKIVLPTEIKS